jgi:hypothetical protein
MAIPVSGVEPEPRHVTLTGEKFILMHTLDIYRLTTDNRERQAIIKEAS